MLNARINGLESAVTRIDIELDPMSVESGNQIGTLARPAEEHQLADDATFAGAARQEP